MTLARRVLVVDDNLDSAELLALILTRDGHEARLAHDAAEAIPLALQFRPHVAFLDIGLPGMDGYELLKVLRSSPELRETKYVAVTGYEELQHVASGAAFDAHLVKPIDLAAVSQLVLDLGATPDGATPVSA